METGDDPPTGDGGAAKRKNAPAQVETGAESANKKSKTSYTNDERTYAVQAAVLTLRNSSRKGCCKAGKPSKCDCMKKYKGTEHQETREKIAESLYAWYNEIKYMDDKKTVQTLRGSIHRKESQKIDEKADWADERVLFRLDFVNIPQDGDEAGDVTKGGGNPIFVCQRVLLSFLARLHHENEKASEVFRLVDYTYKDWLGHGGSVREQHQHLHMIASDSVRKKLDKIWREAQEGGEPVNVNVTLLNVHSWKPFLPFWRSKYPGYEPVPKPPPGKEKKKTSDKAKESEKTPEEAPKENDDEDGEETGGGNDNQGEKTPADGSNNDNQAGQTSQTGGGEKKDEDKHDPDKKAREKLARLFGNWNIKEPLFCHPAVEYAGGTAKANNALKEVMSEYQDASAAAEKKKASVDESGEKESDTSSSDAEEHGRFWYLGNNLPTDNMHELVTPGRNEPDSWDASKENDAIMEHEAKNEGPISLYDAARAEGESISMENKTQMEQRLQQASPEPNLPKWHRKTRGKGIQVGVGRVQWTARRKLTGPYSYRLLNFRVEEDALHPSAILDSVGAVLQKQSRALWEALTEEKKQQESPGGEPGPSKYIVPDRFGQFGGYGVFFLRVEDDVYSDIGDVEAEVCVRVCTSEECMELTKNVALPQSTTSKGKWLFISVREAWEDVMKKNIPGYTTSSEMAAALTSRESPFDKFSGTEAVLKAAKYRYGYKSYSDHLVSGTGNARLWNFPKWLNDTHLLSIIKDGCPEVSKIMFGGWKILKLLQELGNEGETQKKGVALACMVAKMRHLDEHPDAEVKPKEEGGKLLVYTESVDLPATTFHTSKEVPAAAAAVEWRENHEGMTSEKEHYDKSTRGSISIWHAARMEGESLVVNNRPWMEARLELEVGNVDDETPEWENIGQSRKQAGTGEVQFQVGDKIQGPYSHRLIDCEKSREFFEPGNLLNAYGEYFEQICPNLREKLVAEAAKQEQGDQEKGPSDYVVVDEFGQFGGCGVFFFRQKRLFLERDDQESGLDNFPVPCTRADIQLSQNKKTLIGDKEPNARMLRWMYVAIRDDWDVTADQNIPGFKSALKFDDGGIVQGSKDFLASQEHWEYTEGDDVDLYVQNLLGHHPSYWDVKTWSEDSRIGEFLDGIGCSEGRRNRVMFCGWKAMKLLGEDLLPDLHLQGKLSELMLAVGLLKMKTAVHENEEEGDNNPSSDPETPRKKRQGALVGSASRSSVKKNLGGRGNRAKHNWTKDNTFKKHYIPTNRRNEDPKLVPIAVKIDRWKKYTELAELLQQVRGAVGLFPAKASAFMEDCAAVLPNGGLDSENLESGSAEHRHRYEGEDLPSVFDGIARSQDLEAHLKRLVELRGQDGVEAVEMLDETIQEVTQRAIEKQGDTVGEASAKKGGAKYSFYHVVTKRNEVEPAHLDFLPSDLVQRKPVYVAHFPMTKHGMHLQLWTGPSERGTLVYIPLGCVLVLPAHVAHGGGFSTSPDGNIRGLCYIYPDYEKEDGLPKVQPFKLELNLRTLQFPGSYYQPSGYLLPSKVQVDERCSWAEEFASSLYHEEVERYKKHNREWRALKREEGEEFEDVRLRLLQQASDRVVVLQEGLLKEAEGLQPTVTPKDWECAAAADLDDKLQMEMISGRVLDDRGKVMVVSQRGAHPFKRLPAVGNLGMSFFGPTYKPDGSVNGPGTNQKLREALQKEVWDNDGVPKNIIEYIKMTFGEAAGGDTEASLEDDEEEEPGFGGS